MDQKEKTPSLGLALNLEEPSPSSIYFLLHLSFSSCQKKFGQSKKNKNQTLVWLQFWNRTKLFFHCRQASFGAKRSLIVAKKRKVKL